MEFESRHDLAFAGDGFVLPRLLIAPASAERMNVEWTAYQPEHARVEFLRGGRKTVERSGLDLELRTLIEAVLQRAQANTETRRASDDLGRIWSRLNNLADDEVEFCRAAALFGADPFDLESEASDRIVEFWNRADASVREDALALAGGAELPPVADWLSNAQKALAESWQHNEWPGIRDALPAVAASALPWERGYELARCARGHIGQDGGPIDLECGPAAVPHHETSPPPIGIQALVGDDGPGCVAVPRPPLSTRFIQARALGDFLGRVTTGFGLLSSLATERQAQSRAFAAEFLAPSASLRQRIDSERVDSDRIEDLGREFSVSATVIEHQIRNHGIAHIVPY